MFTDDAATAGTNKAAKSTVTLNTRKLDEETENLARKFLSCCIFRYMVFCCVCLASVAWGIVYMNSFPYVSQLIWGFCSIKYQSFLPWEETWESDW